MQEEFPSVRVESVIGECAKLKAEGYRFVTMSCVELDESSLHILYHFDKSLEMKHLRLTVSKDTQVPSLSPVYFAAFLVENEIQDHFGVVFKDLALDYKRTLYLEEEVQRTPFCRYSVGRKSEDEAKAGAVTA